MNLLNNVLSSAMDSKTNAIAYYEFDNVDYIYSKPNSGIIHVLMIRHYDKTVDGVSMYKVPAKQMVEHENNIMVINNNYKEVSVKNLGIVRHDLKKLGYKLKENVTIYG